MGLRKWILLWLGPPLVSLVLVFADPLDQTPNIVLMQHDPSFAEPGVDTGDSAALA
jgi:hypothetical protein